MWSKQQASNNIQFVHKVFIDALYVLMWHFETHRELFSKTMKIPKMLRK